jgi:hypothetical protein
VPSSFDPLLEKARFRSIRGKLRNAAFRPDLCLNASLVRRWTNPPWRVTRHFSKFQHLAFAGHKRPHPILDDAHE